MSTTQKPLSQLGRMMLTIGAVSLIVLLFTVQPSQGSIGYFEHYGWPTYGIVKPFWMTPFSAFPSRSISSYSRKHSIYNGRGALRFNDY